MRSVKGRRLRSACPSTRSPARAVAAVRGDAGGGEEEEGPNV